MGQPVPPEILTSEFSTACSLGGSEGVKDPGIWFSGNLTSERLSLLTIELHFSTAYEQGADLIPKITAEHKKA